MLLRFPLTAGCLVLSAAAGIIQHPKRDLQGLARAFDKIFHGLEDLTSKVETYAGAESNTGVLAANDKIANEITTGATEIKSSKTMGIPDLLNIFGPVAVMENQVGELVVLLSKNKDKLKAGNLPVLDMLMKDRKAADGLVKSIKANLPLQAIIGQFAGPVAATITSQLDKGITEWGGTPPAAAAASSSDSGGLLGSLASGLGSLGGLAFGSKGSGSKGGGASSAPKASGGSSAPKASGGKSSPKKGSGSPKSSSPPAPAPAPASAPADAGMAGMAGMSHGSRRL